jgi:hypothetical protein
MATAATSSSIFPYFASLPSELRSQIWRDALPDKDGSALYLYQKGCWCPRYLSPSEEMYDPNARDNLILEFRHDLLDQVQVEAPLVFVNREARGTALTWLREQGVEKRFLEERQCHVFVRQFDPIRDTLYLTSNRANDFYSEPYDRLFGPDLRDKNILSGPGLLERIAMPEALFRNEATTLHEIFEWFSGVSVLFIIVGAQPDLEDGMKAQRRWELESIQGRTFSWNHDRRSFDFGNSDYIDGEALYRQIEEASKSLGEWITLRTIRSFEIRLVFAVRR